MPPVETVKIANPMKPGRYRIINKANLKPGDVLWCEAAQVSAPVEIVAEPVKAAPVPKVTEAPKRGRPRKAESE